MRGHRCLLRALWPWAIWYLSAGRQTQKEGLSLRTSSRSLRATRKRLTMTHPSSCHTYRLRRTTRISISRAYYGASLGSNQCAGLRLSKRDVCGRCSSFILAMYNMHLSLSFFLSMCRPSIIAASRLAPVSVFLSSWLLWLPSLMMPSKPPCVSI